MRQHLFILFYFIYLFSVAAEKGDTATVQLSLECGIPFFNCFSEEFTDLNLDQKNVIKDDNISYRSLDIASKHSVRLFLDELYKRCNSIDVLINNAGVSTFEPFEDRTEESFDWVLNINLKAKK